MKSGAGLVATLAIVAITACSPSPTPAVALARPAQTTATATAFMTVSPTADPAGQYLALATKVNSQWAQIGSPQDAAVLSVPRQQEYVAAWRALENQIADGLAVIEWPAAISPERSALDAAVEQLQTLLQASAEPEAYLALIGFQPLNDQRAAAAAIRIRLGLPQLGPSDLI